ncbi:MerR family transcriptional regulator [Tardiphaga sp. 619_E2_N8_5]|uniref:MerR family transcriptional regulator n=1 Tax=unclassified Tardiphaga TaxID=2631404 RepID=UPI003F24E4B7
MNDRELLSPRDVSKELHVTNRTLQRWASVGLLRPSHFTAGGHARYDRASIDAMKRRQRHELKVDPSTIPYDEESSSQLRADTGRANLASVNETRRDSGLVFSSAMERAKRAAERGAKAQRIWSGLQDEAVRTLLGIERGELFSRIWRYQLVKVAEALGVSSSRLRDICDLYDIPTPPPGYWLTKPERRGVRILRGNASAKDTF